MTSAGPAPSPLRATELMVRLGGNDLGPFNIVVQPGELVCTLGGNGSGKTTAIRLALGLIRATRGTSLIFNETVSPTAPPKGVGYVPDKAEFWNWETASGNLRPFTQHPEATTRALERVGLSHVANTPVRRFSRGMRQRLSIARGVIDSPELLVMDEPTIALDVEGVDMLVDLIAERRASGNATLVATHDQGFLDRLDGRRIINVANGRTT